MALLMGKKEAKGIFKACGTVGLPSASEDPGPPGAAFAAMLV
jgi:hypothetical protein